MSRPDPDDVARRARAAMAYADMDRTEAASALHVSPATLDRITGRRAGRPRGADWADLWNLAEACGLPPEWFSADLSRLHEIVPPGMPTVVRASDVDAGAPAAGHLASPAPRPGRADPRRSA